MQGHSEWVRCAAVNSRVVNWYRTPPVPNPPHAQESPAGGRDEEMTDNKQCMVISINIDMM